MHAHECKDKKNHHHDAQQLCLPLETPLCMQAIPTLCNAMIMLPLPVVHSHIHSLLTSKYCSDYLFVIEDLHLISIVVDGMQDGIRSSCCLHDDEDIAEFILAALLPKKSTSELAL